MAHLQRRLNRIDALAIAIGSVVGVGVFRNTGVVLAGAGGFGNATILWIVIGLVCLAGAMLYADLSARIPEAGGPYAYVRVAFGRPAGFVYGWMNAAVAMPVRQASIVAAISELVSPWLPGGPRLIAITAMVVLAVVNLLGVKAGAITQRFFTAGKVATIVLVIGLALVLGGRVPASTATIQQATFVSAVAAVWYTYLGWQDVVLLAEELHQPRKDLPVVLVGTVLFAIALYLGIHAAIYYGLGGTAEAYGATPGIRVAELVLGGFGLALLSGLTVSSMTGGAAESMMVRPRVAMALARDGMAPRQIAAIDAAGTPYGAILFHSALSLVLVASGSYISLLPLLTFAQGFLGIFEVASYFVVRKKRPDFPTSRLHPWGPLVFIAANIALCALSASADPPKTGIALGLIAVVSVIGLVVLRPAQSIPEKP
jgi:APA family basic amino acid/polyamine antiporter